jgi:hypothetical protein
MARMARLNVVTFIAASFCLPTSSCDGDVALFTSPPIVVSALDDAGPSGPASIDPPATTGSVPSVVVTGNTAPVGMPPPPPPVQPSASDAGALGTEPDASPAPAVPEPIVVEGPVAELPRLGVAGGDPRLGLCQGGVVIGVRTTANPSEGTFGQRLTFIEPICGKAVHLRADPSAAPSGEIRVTRDDSILDWAVTDGFLGVPATEVPDPILTWVLQPATVCPQSAPVVVGLSGEYDPVAPDVVDTAAIRSLFIECAPLILAANGIDVAAGEADHQLISHADSFAAAGAAAYRSACEGGAVTTQIKVHAGFWLDGFVLGCSNLRAE